MNNKIGILILSAGILYLVLISWFFSWSYVPDFRGSGMSFVTESTFYTSMAFFILWSVSAPLGSILVLFGFGLYAQTDRNRIFIFVLISLFLLWWLAQWHVSIITSTLFGIGGGIIILCFIISVWSWAKKRNKLNERDKIASDIRMLGHLFFFVAAWGICGLLGTPAFAIRPELVIDFNTQEIVYTLAAKVMICLITGWICLATSQYLNTRTK